MSTLCTVTSTQLEEEETKERAVYLVSEVLNSCGRQLVAGQPAVLQAVTAHLSQLWENSSADSPLRVTITETMVSLVKTAGTQSPLLHGAALPLIGTCCVIALAFALALVFVFLVTFLTHAPIHHLIPRSHHPLPSRLLHLEQQRMPLLAPPSRPSWPRKAYNSGCK